MLTSSAGAYFLDFSYGQPPPVSDRFVVHQGWLLTRELTVYSNTSYCKDRIY